MLRPYTAALTTLVASLAALAPLTMDIYLPSLPDVARTLGATPAQAQLTISSYLIGAAIGVIIYGPIADRYGRRPVLLVALAVYCVANAICALAPSIEVLIGGRMLQALGPSCTSVIARAIIRDLYEGREMSRQMSLLTTLIAFGPLVAPPLGGIIQTTFGWRPVFGLLFSIGAAALAMAWALLPETLRTRSSEGLSAPALLRTYRSLVRNRSYVAHISILSVTYLGLVAWLSGAPFVLQNQYGMSPMVFSVTFIIATGGFIIGAAIAARVVLRLGVDRCIGVGVVLLACAGFIMIIVVSTNVLPGISLILSMTLYMIGVGFVFPQGQAGALAPFRDRAGAASSFTGFTQQAAGALLGVLVGRALGEDALHLAALIAVFGCVALILWVLTRRVRLDAAAELLD